MTISYPSPTDKISDFVQSILVIENSNVSSPFCLPLYANGTPTLLFHTAKGQMKNSSNYLTLFGQTVAPDNLILSENFTLIAYFLKPFSLSSLFSISAQELTDKPVELSALSNNTSLLQELLNSQSTNQMLRRLDDYIFKLSQKIKHTDGLLQYIAERISAHPNGKILCELQKEIGMTERTFQRLFEKNIGLPPNRYRKIIQFNNAFRQLNKKQFIRFSDIAFENDYADQSHYIRAFKEFTSMTPTEYLNKL
jgi:AraC-like DNA-binding protein